MGKLVKSAIRGTAAIMTGGASELLLNKKKIGMPGVDPQKQAFRDRLKAGAFQAPDANRSASFAKASRKEQEASAAQKAQQAADSRAQQDAFIQRLQGQAAGTGQSDAQAAIDDAARRQAAQFQAQLASRRGFAGGALARAAARNQAALQQQAAQQRQQIGAQEQLASQQALAEQLSKQRQADIGAQQAAAQSQLSGQQADLGLQQAQQQATAQGAIFATEDELADAGARLQKNLSDIQKSNQRSGAIGNLVGTGVGAFFGGPVGASIGGSLGGMLQFNEGGKVPKMNKDEKFGFKKAIDAEKKNEKYKNGKQMKSLGGAAKPFRLDPNKADTVEAKIEKATQLPGGRERIKAATAQTKAAQEQAKMQAANAEQARANQQALAQQLMSRDAASLTRMQTKAASDKSLAQQLAAAGRTRRAATPAQMALNAQAASQPIVQSAAQSALNEQSQVQNLLGQQLGQQRMQDLQQQDFARNLALQQLQQEGQVREAERQLAAQDASLSIERRAALNSLAAQKAAAPKQKKFLGLFNEGGVIPGKAKVKGDSEKNDTVPALLSPGEIVIPRTVVEKGQDAMVGFIKGIESMSDGGKTKYATGGMTSDFSFLNKEGTGLSADGANIAQQGLGIAGALGKQKKEEKAKQRAEAKIKFDQALRNIKSMRKFSCGGKVTKKTYGDMISAKKELEKKIKELSKKGY